MATLPPGQAKKFTLFKSSVMGDGFAYYAAIRNATGERDIELIQFSPAFLAELGEADEIECDIKIKAP